MSGARTSWMNAAAGIAAFYAVIGSVAGVFLGPRYIFDAVFLAPLAWGLGKGRSRVAAVGLTLLSLVLLFMNMSQGGGHIASLLLLLVVAVGATVESFKYHQTGHLSREVDGGVDVAPTQPGSKQTQPPTRVPQEPEAFVVLRPDKTESGWVTEATLRKWYGEGAIGPTARVSRASDPRWFLLSDVVDLANWSEASAPSGAGARNEPRADPTQGRVDSPSVHGQHIVQVEVGPEAAKEGSSSAMKGSQPGASLKLTDLSSSQLVAVLESPGSSADIANRVVEELSRRGIHIDSKNLSGTSCGVDASLGPEGSTYRTATDT